MSDRNILIRIIYKISRFFNNLRKFLQLILVLLIFGIIIASFAEQKVPVPAKAALLVNPSGALVEELQGVPVDRALAELTGDPLQQ